MSDNQQPPLVPPLHSPAPIMDPPFNAAPPQKQPMPGWKIGLIVGSVVLVVVLAIAAVIAYRVVAMHRRERERQAAAIANIKQIGAAMKMYTKQNNDQYPNLNAAWNGEPKLADTSGDSTGGACILVENGLVVSWVRFICPTSTSVASQPATAPTTAPSSQKAKP